MTETTPALTEWWAPWGVYRALVRATVVLPTMCKPGGERGCLTSTSPRSRRGWTSHDGLADL